METTYVQDGNNKNGEVKLIIPLLCHRFFAIFPFLQLNLCTAKQQLGIIKC